LSAFAEDALPQPIRLNIVSHLADCNSCRQILSNLILLNEAAQEEAATIAEPEKNIVATKPSWLDSFKKFFAFPTLGYATAALSVLLISSFAFIALRGTQEKDSASVVQVEPEQTQTQAKQRPAAPPQTAAKDEENELKQAEDIPVEMPNTNTEMLAASTPTPSENEVDNLPPSVRATRGINRSSPSANAPPARDEVSAANSSNLNSGSNISAPELQPAAPMAGAAAKSVTRENEIARAAPKPEEKAKAELRKRTTKDQEVEADDKSDLAEIAPQVSERQAAASSASGRMNKRVVVETRTVGGKTFQKVGVVWFDSAYNSQNATSISRGSNEYKKLDSGLRSIAENLSGEIMVVWQGKAYRIR